MRTNNLSSIPSRFGISGRRGDPLLSEERIANNPGVQRLKVLPLLWIRGIKDTIYLARVELKRRLIKLYADLKKILPELRAINIGGGMPIRNTLSV